jgi:hypothetical protein
MWPGSDHDNDRLDRAIDDVARRMTEGAPSADLKALVLARIEAPDASWWPRRLAWFATAVAAAAAIVLVVVLWPLQHTERGTETMKQASSVARTADRPLPPSAPQETARATAPTGASSAGTTTARTSIATSRRLLRSLSDIERMAPPPLEVPSIAVPSLPISDIGTPSIAVEPLETITPIAVSPIGEGDRP